MDKVTKAINFISSILLLIVIVIWLCNYFTAGRTVNVYIGHGNTYSEENTQSTTNALTDMGYLVSSEL